MSKGNQPPPEERPSGDGSTSTSFRVLPDRAAVVFVARSNAGPITFGATGIEGSIDAEVDQGAVSTRIQPAARLQVPIDKLTSGNQLYDAELMRRVDARLFPHAVVELQKVSPVGRTGRYHVQGELTFHGVTQSMEGTVSVSFPSPERMVVEGEQILDMRHFHITPPTVAMLRIYPDVRVQLHLEAKMEG